MRWIVGLVVVVSFIGCAVEPELYEKPRGLPRHHSGVYHRAPWAYVPPVQLEKEMEDLTYEYAWRDWLTERSTRWAAYEVDLDLAFRRGVSEMEAFAAEVGVDEAQKRWMIPPLYPPVSGGRHYPGFSDFGWRMSPFWHTLKE
ncbi:MAG: hypothetical protein N2234_07805 [Planctomycetota bacterium]|nr:hypothetical protein [Planctomycetota bacterium]